MYFLDVCVMEGGGILLVVFVCLYLCVVWGCLKECVVLYFWACPTVLIGGGER